MEFHGTSSPMPTSTPLIWYTGKSYGLKIFKSDSVHYIDSDIPVKDVTKVDWVIDIGTTVNKCFGNNGVAFYLPCVLYHIHYICVWLIYLQDYHHIHGGHSAVYGFKVKWFFWTTTLWFLLIIKKGIYLWFTTPNWHQKKIMYMDIKSGMPLSYLGLRQLYFFGYILPTNILWHYPTET